MNKKLVAILALFFVLAGIALYSAKLTGLTIFTDGRSVNVSISEYPYGRVVFINFTPVVQVYAPQTITTEFINTGSVPYQAHVQIRVKDLNFTDLAVYDDDYLNFSIFDARRYSVIYTANVTGYYWIQVRVPYVNTYTEAWALYYVNSTIAPQVITPPSTLPPTYQYSPSTIIQGNQTANQTGNWTGTAGNRTGSGTGAPWEGTGGVRGTPAMTIEYPSNISVSQNQTALAYVFVKNPGNGSLQNVIMPLSSIDVGIDITPKLIPEIARGEEGIFIITVSAAADKPTGVYPIDFSVMSGGLVKKGHIDVYVGLMPVMDELTSAILNYAFLLKRIREDARQAAMGGRNTTLVLMHVDEGERVLDLARKSFAKGDIETTRGHLVIVKGHIENAVLELARAVKVEALYAVFPILTIILSIIGFAVIGILLYLHKKKREEKGMKEGETSG